MIDADRFFASLWHMTIRTRNRLFAFSIMAAPFVFLICLILFWDAEPLPPVPPLPNPNGYNDLVKAGKMIQGDVWNYEKASVEEMREIVATNADALLLAHTALSNQCRVPLEFTKAYITNHIQDLRAFRRLAQTLATEGELAKREKRFTEAVNAYLDLTHLGNEAAHGGVLVDEMIGIAINSLGEKGLEAAMIDLDAKTCRETAAALETLNAQGQTWDEVIKQENDWSRRTFTGIRYQFARLMDRKSQHEIFQKAEQNYKKQQNQMRQLIIDLAARAYTLDKGHRPASVSDLVPDYLKAIPQDPVTGNKMGLK